MIEPTVRGRTVHVVPEAADHGKMLWELLPPLGAELRLHTSPQGFLDGYVPTHEECLITGVRLAGMTGLELQHSLQARGSLIAVIFLTEHDDAHDSVRAMKDGAFDYFVAPFDDKEVCDRIREAIDESGRRHDAAALAGERERRLSRLTSREREVMSLVVEGHASKVIAGELMISKKTVDLHRANVMRKTKCATVAELVRLVVERDR